ncbi:MAG: carboxypeptidase-like regulatory domain-containing protein [Polaribacter sp.]|uniref:carboxypeptidase-like regulatory domain-containing protein n=1 Tax=Polaribacter sp. TaxID=1920175 RepID=UPI003BB0127F
MKTKLTLFLLLIPIYILSQTTLELELKSISGFIKHNNKALENVTIFVENTTRYSVSDAKGFYTIKAKPGEILSYSYVGFETLIVLLEDVTNTLNIDLKPESIPKSPNIKKTPKLGESTIGDEIQNFLALKIEVETLNKDATSLTRAIEEKLPNVLVRLNKYGEEVLYIKGKEFDGSAIWEIDNYQYDIPFPVYISEVKELFILNQKNQNPIIKVKTTIDYSKLKNVNFNNYYFTDDDFYSNDAIKYDKIKKDIPFLDKYKEVSNATETLDLYTKTYTEDKANTNYHLDIFNFFQEEKLSKSLLIKILEDYEVFANQNSEDLKAVAYKYEELGQLEKAIEIYKKIIKIRPNHRQSYRDLANVFLELKKYRDFWFTYNYFLNKGFKIEDNDIGEVITSEIMATYNLDQENESNSVQKININEPSKNIESDVRIVIEWNSTEAEFVLEFVNPDAEIFLLENSSNHNLELIMDQKIKGYTSKEIFIEELASGNYLLNLTYLGNKQYKPTLFKITTYYNWGKPNQTKNMDVFEFTTENIKAQLLKLDRRKL